MKNICKVFGIIALVAVIGFSMAGCDSDNGSKDTVTTTNKLIATVSDASGGSNFKSALDVTLTSKSSRSARSAISDGTYEYSMELAGVVINIGTLVVENGDYMFTSSEGVEFEYLLIEEDETYSFIGSIPISAAAKTAINTAYGSELAIPNSLSMDAIMEAKVNSGGYWNGTWERFKVEVDPDTYDETEIKTGQKMVFNGANYTLTQKDGTTETGTFVYFDPSQDESGGDSVFVFTRNVTSGPKVAAYLWEGNAQPIPEYDIEDTMLELYNYMKDPMKIACNTDEAQQLDERWFRKE